MFSQNVEINFAWNNMQCWYRTSEKQKKEQAKLKTIQKISKKKKL